MGSGNAGLSRRNSGSLKHQAPDVKAEENDRLKKTIIHWISWNHPKFTALTIPTACPTFSPNRSQRKVGEAA